MFNTPKVNVFNAAENYKVKEDSEEFKYLKIVEKINNGRIISKWKEQQNMQ